MPAVEFLESHLEEDLPHLADDPLVGVDLPGIRLLRELGHVVPAEVCGLPLAREDLLAGEGAGLLAEVETFLREREPFGSDGNGVPDGLGFLQDPTFDEFFCLRVGSGRVFECRFIRIG